MFTLDCFWRVQSPSCSLTNPPWGYKPGSVPSLKGTTIVMWCGQYHSKSQQHDRKCTATHQYWCLEVSILLHSVSVIIALNQSLNSNNWSCTSQEGSFFRQAFICAALLTFIGNHVLSKNTTVSEDLRCRTFQPECLCQLLHNTLLHWSTLSLLTFVLHTFGSLDKQWNINKYCLKIHTHETQAVLVLLKLR